MMQLSAKHWWVQRVMKTNTETGFLLRKGRPVSLCLLFWAGLHPLWIVSRTIILFTWFILLGSAIVISFAGLLYLVGLVKEFVFLCAILGVVALVTLGISIWKPKRKDVKIVPSIPVWVSEGWWGLKNRVCPMVQIVSEETDADVS